jgi:hypothetical protein
MRPSRVKYIQRVALSALANRRYDEEVARSDGRYDARQPARSVSAGRIVAAYVDGSKSQQEGIEEFRGPFRFI